MMIRRHLAAAALAACLAAAPAPLHAQDVEEAGGTLVSAAIGTGAGLVGGAYANLAMVVLKARMGHYQHSFQEAFGWESIPILVGGGVGFAIGFWDDDRLWPWILYGAAGTGAGIGVGYLVGALVWGDSESKWADAAIGAAIGMAVGSTVGIFMVGGDDDTASAGDPAAALSRPRIHVPLLRLSF